jgi:hypothetical protein
MTHLDPHVEAILDRFVPVPEETGDWGRVLAGAGTIEQRRRPAVASRRLALALVVVAALASTLAFVPALAGQGYFWFLNDGAPRPSTPVANVTSFTDRAGTTWYLTAYGTAEKGGSLCFQLTNDERNGAGACGTPMPIGVMVFSAPDGEFVAGPVTADASRVEIVGLAEPIEATVATAPEAIQRDLKFYVAEVPAADVPLTVQALDVRGRVISTLSVPTRDR